MLVQVQGQPDSAPRTVVFYWWSVIVSSCLFLNVTLMPLKAYISEPFPWVLQPHHTYDDICSVNYTACGEALDRAFRIRSESMHPGTNYIFGQDFDLVRQTLTISPGAHSLDPAFLLQTSYGQFYSQRVRRELLEVGANIRNASDLHVLQLSKMLGVVAAYVVFWIEPGQQPSQYYLFTGLQLPVYSDSYRWVKFVCRVTMALMLVGLMWRRYYCHYVHLAHGLRTVGLPVADKCQRYYVLLGDPTSMVLLEPALCGLFILDFFASSDFASRALVRICQTQDWSVFFIASLYLSRTVWCGYASIAVVSRLLEKYPHWRFEPVDPGLLAIAIFVLAGPVTYLQSRSLLVIALYQWIDSCVLSAEAKEMGTEGALGGVVFTTVFASLPLMYGFGRPWLDALLRQASSRVAPGPRIAVKTMTSVVGGAFASVSSNDAKHRWLMTLCLALFRGVSGATVGFTGGSLHALIASNVQLKRHRGLSQTGADAYVLFFATPRDAKRLSWTSVRLSLRSCVHPLPCTSDGPSRGADAQALDKANATCAVGWLELHPKTHLRVGANDSPWVL
ncbi:hypothetical protein ACHHYP_15257 [Achlya hypogyna]|uniref:Transmembrane protein n=1 Tax=Achlya hypogyna TaxID=1202772 RepID=A0A1V9YBC0_ACHHY|nr:hypothetical protein ACHHYP_15257 [Achlya hypogyna]